MSLFRRLNLRTVFVVRRLFSTGTVVRAAAAGSEEAAKQVGPPVIGRIPDEHEQAVGIERKELELLRKGVKDPFGLEGVKWGPRGTKENPRLIPSHFDERIVGCCCDPESELISYLIVKSGELASCPCCSQVFKLVPAESEISW